MQDFAPDFDPRRALSWLCSASVVGPSGAVRSWHNPQHPGYDYPEAGGLLLSLLCDGAYAGAPPAGTIADRIAGDLARTADADAIGRHGTRYLFDEAIVLAGLCRHARRRRGVEAGKLDAWLRRCIERVHAGVACEPPRPERWSTLAGPHLLKLAITVGAWSDVDEAARDGLAALLHGASLRALDGRIATGVDHDGPTYLHAHCYAVEGALRLAAGDLLAAAPTRRARQLAMAGAAWLSRVQRPEGGLPAWHDGTHGHGVEPSDVAAQAIRIWALVDRAAFASEIDRAWYFLSRCAAPSGAVRYHAGSADENTWATIFAVQAAHLARHGGSATCLI
ncbi:MAG: hypothetical protein AAF721_12685 [Myxococcota bacterium]